MSSVVPILLIATAVGGIALSFVRAARQRAKLTRVRARSSVPRRPVGESSLDVADGAQVVQDDLLAAMRIKSSTKLDDDGNDDFGDPLGLKVIAGETGSSAAGGVGRPQVMHGSRHGHQVFVRQGLVGDALSPGLGFRKDRSVTLVRVAAPPCEWTAREGRLVADDRVPAEITGILGPLSADPDIWHDLRGVSGPEGIAVSRAAWDVAVAGWVYDLWLLERIAHVLALPPLENVRLFRDWRLPYGLTDWKPSIAAAGLR